MSKKSAQQISIWGNRRPRMRDAAIILKEATTEATALPLIDSTKFGSLRHLRESFVPVSRSYFALAAMTRRTELKEVSRSEGLAQLFSMRTLIESRLLDQFRFNAGWLRLEAEATKDSFFGKSKKQGVSIRYALASCVPTATCGGRCYAHDGRDRELLHIYRGVLNYYIGLEFQNGSPERRQQILALLSKSIDKGVEAALADQASALSEGYNRLPRIRFSHVGEMASTPEFTNALAAEVKKRDPRVQCVIYTRHPKAKLLDSNLLVINFTLEGAGDVRQKFAPTGARIVNSSWDGEINEKADVNFLEHHVEKSAIGIGTGSICPVTANHKVTPSCDSALCQKCFVPVTIGARNEPPRFIAACPPNPTAPRTSVRQGSEPFLPKPKNPRRRTKPEKVRRF